MRKLILTAAALSLSVPIATNAYAQSAQERLDARYDRALSAGYKAMMLCSGIATAERNGKVRSPDHVHKWELSGIYPALDPIIRDLPFKIVRGEPIQFRTPDAGFIRHVEVSWANTMPPRIAEFRGEDGCAVLPIGTDPATLSDKTSAFRKVPPVLSVPIDRSNTVLQDIGRKAFDGTYGDGSRTTGVLVSRNDRMVFEQFAQGFDRNTPQRTWSVAKSIAATLVGMAVHESAIDVSQSAGAGLNEDDPRSRITIDHMLRMASGRYSDTPGNRTDPLYWGGATVDERARVWPLIHTPGTVYRYANNDTLMAVEAIQPWLNQRRRERLVNLLGMFDASLEMDWRGNRVLSSQVWASASDLHALGQLYIDNGIRTFRPEGVFSKDWRDYVSNPSGPQPEGTRWGYGAGWWTFRRPEGNAFEGIPDDAFAARGNRGQYVVVVPSRQVVIVRRGEDMVGTRFDIAAFTRDVLAALKE